MCDAGYKITNHTEMEIRYSASTMAQVKIEKERQMRKNGANTPWLDTKCKSVLNSKCKMKPNHTCVLLRENMHQVVEMMMMIVVRLL